MLAAEHDDRQESLQWATLHVFVRARRVDCLMLQGAAYHLRNDWPI